MTNEFLETQPALRPLNVLVRGGRLTKFKGRVASIAPGLLVVATVAVLFTGNVAHASECGQEVPNQTNLTCNSSHSTAIENGITYTNTDGLNLTLPENPELSVGGSGVSVHGRWGHNRVHMEGGSVIATDDAENHGLHAELETTDMTTDFNVLARIEGGNVETSGLRAHGLYASSNGNGSVEARVEGGTVTSGGHGAFAEATGNAEARAELSGDGDITINKDASVGLGARISNAASEKTVTATMTGGKITIEGDARSFSAGVSAFTLSRQGSAVVSGGDVTAHMSGGFIHNKAEVGSQDASFAIDAGSHQTDYIGTVTALMSGGEIYTENARNNGVRATTRSTDAASRAVAHMSGGKITTKGGGSFAVLARIGSEQLNPNLALVMKAGVEAKMTGGEIDAQSATAIKASHIGAGDATVEMDEVDGRTSKITTRGNQVHGMRADAVFAHDDSEGVAKAVMRAGTIIIGAGMANDSGDSSFGAAAQANGGKGKALVEMHGGTIKIENGSQSYGLYARIAHANNEQESKVEMTGGVITGGPGGGSHGLVADTIGSGAAVVDMGRGEVTTRGNGSHGILAQAGAQANGVRFDRGSAAQAEAIVRLGTHAKVKAEGAGSDGIRVSGNVVRTVDNDPTSTVTLGARGFEIEVAGSVTGGAGNGAAIRTISSKAGTIDITSTATVAAGDSGIAIRTTTAGAAGDPIAGVDDGTATITSAGTITGDILLDAGDDTLIVTGGSITGDVYGSQGDNTLRLERGRFTGDIRFVAGDNSVEMEDGRFTGGIYGGAGNDTVTISADATYVGSHVLDGGAGGNDQLTLHGQTISNTAENFRNWERVTLNDTNLRLAGVARLDIDQLSINAGSAFRASGGGGGITIAGDVINNGSVVLSVQDGAADDVITIEGDYTGSGRSVVALDAVLAGNDANTDQLVITGDMSGEMMLSVTNLDSAGGEDTPLEINVASVTGEFDGTFTLVGGNHVTADGTQAVVSGAHLYTLAEAETGRGWVLSAMSETGGRNWQPSAPIYDSYGQSLLALNGPASLRSRGSSEDFRSLAWDGGPADQNRDTPLWFQMGGERITSSEEHSTTGAALESSIWEMEIGGDVVVSESGAGLLVGGLMFSYATGSASVSSEFGDGSIDTSGFGLGVAATWYDHRRFYVDGQVSLASYSSDLEADRIGTLTEGNGGTGLAFSIEAGQQLDLGSSLTVIPQAQLSLSSVAFDDFEGERYGEQVTLEDASSQQLRLGLEFGAQEQGAHRLYGIVNLFHEFGAGSEVNVAGATLTTESEPWAVGIGLGGNYALTDRVDLFGEASYATGLSNAGDTSALSANAGLKMVF